MKRSTTALSAASLAVAFLSGCVALPPIPQPAPPLSHPSQRGKMAGTPPIPVEQVIVMQPRKLPNTLSLASNYRAEDSVSLLITPASEYHPGATITETVTRSEGAGKYAQVVRSASEAKSGMPYYTEDRSDRAPQTFSSENRARMSPEQIRDRARITDIYNTIMKQINISASSGVVLRGVDCNKTPGTTKVECAIKYNR